MRKLAWAMIPDEEKLTQSAFLLAAASAESRDPSEHADNIVALELIKAGYEIRDKFVNKSPAFATHFYTRDKIDINYAFLISDLMISRGLSRLYLSCDRRMAHMIDEMVADVVSSRLDAANLLKSDSLDLKKYVEIIVRSLGSLVRVGLVSIKKSAVINTELQKTVSSLARNFAVACEFSEDFVGFFGGSGPICNDFSAISLENANIIFVLLLLKEVASEYEGTAIADMIGAVRSRGPSLSHKELWKIKLLLKKYNVTDSALKTISDNAGSARQCLGELGWSGSGEIGDFLTILLRSNWDAGFIQRMREDAGKR